MEKKQLEKKQRGRITREQLIEATELTFRRVSAHEVTWRASARKVTVPSALKRELREIARTVDRIAWGWELQVGRVKPPCGCLIGTYRMGRGLSSDPKDQSRVQSVIGYEFVEALIQVGAESRDYYDVVG
jgi:hypothetical protein